MNEPLINKLRGAVNSDVSLQQMWQALHDFKEGAMRRTAFGSKSALPALIELSPHPERCRG